MTENRRYYSRVKKIQEAFSPDSASAAIEAGWELLSIRDLTSRELRGDLPIIVTRPIYILGWMKE